MTTRLKLYNEALRICGETSLASLTEDREPRHLLDEVWDNGGVKACLEAGQWRFALRTIQLDYDADITPEFGLQRAFQKPTDWCATSSVSANSTTALFLFWLSSIVLTSCQSRQPIVS